MTAEEVALFKRVGQTWLFRGLATPLIAAVSFGITIPLAIYASLILRSRKPLQRSAYLMHWGTIACLLFSSIHFAGEFAKISLDFDLAYSLDRHSGNLAALTVDLGYVNDRTWNAFLVRNWVDSIGLILSDAVVIWRTCVLLPTRQIWAIVPPVFLLFASGSLSMTACVFGSTVKGSKVQTSHQKEVFNMLTEICYVLSLTANILATGVFGWRLLRLHQLRPKSTSSTSSWRKSSVQKTLWLLVESGVVFCVVQLAVIIMLPFSNLGKINTLAKALGFDIITRGQYALSIIYPILVVVLVRSKNSAADTYSTYDVPETPTMEVNPSVTKVENES